MTRHLLLLAVTLTCTIPTRAPATTPRAGEAPRPRRTIAPERDRGHHDGATRSGRATLTRTDAPPLQPVSRTAYEPHAAPAAPPAAELVRETPRPLPRRSSGITANQPVRTQSSPFRVLITAASSLSIVLGLFAVVVWIAKRRAGTPIAPLPKEVLEVLGRSRLADRQSVQLIRLGHRLLLVSVTQAGMETLAEVVERDEVDRITGLCQQYRPGSASAAFREVLNEMGTKTGSRLVRDMTATPRRTTGSTVIR